MDWLKRQVKRLGTFVLVGGIAVTMFVLRQVPDAGRMVDDVGRVADNVAASVPDMVRLTDELYALDGSVITNSRLIQHLPSRYADMRLDAVIQSVSVATDVPWDVISGIYDDIRELEAFDRAVDAMTAQAQAELTAQMEPGPVIEPGWNERGAPLLSNVAGAGASLAVFFGTETNPEGIAEAVFMNAHSAWLPLPSSYEFRNLLDTTPEPPATGEIAVVHLVPFEGQVAYAVEYGRFDGLAFCSRAVEAGILQRRSNPTSTMELAILTSWARLAQAQGTICTTTLLEGTSTYRFEYTYPDGRSIPGLTASERSHHAATFVRPDMSRDFWDSLLDILERS
jgi:hypothetical protein